MRVTEEESREQLRRMAAQAAEVDAARMHVQDRERQLTEVSGQLAAVQQALQEKSEEATRLTKSAEDAAAALATLQSEAASAASQKDDVIKALQVRSMGLPSPDYEMTIRVSCSIAQICTWVRCLAVPDKNHGQ